MLENTTIKNINNPIKDDIYYQIVNGEISFFYRDFLLFKHNKNNPVLSVIMYKGVAEKEIPLLNYNIDKINVNEFEIEFYNQLYKVNINLKLSRNILDIQVNNHNNYPGLKINLKNSVGKIKGFGCYKEDVFNGKEICSDGWKSELRKQIREDKILAFYKEKKYFLCAEGNFEWKVRFGSLIEMYFNKARFFNIRVIFGKDIEEIKNFLPILTHDIFERSGIILKSTVSGINNLIFSEKAFGEKVSTILLCDDNVGFWDLYKIREILRKRNIKLIRKIQPKISIKDDYFNEFIEDDFIKNTNNKVLIEKGKEDFVYFDLSSPETCRKVKNYLRRILGTNIDGLYSVEKENEIYNRIEYFGKAKGISVMWQSIVYEVSQEYLTPKTLIFDTLTSSTNFYGYYLMESKTIFSLRYKNYFENLKNSGIYNIVVGFNLFESAVFKNFENKLKQKYNIIYK